MGKWGIYGGAPKLVYKSLSRSFRPSCPAEFRQQMVELVRAGRAPAELSREFNVTAKSITNWVGQATIDSGNPLPDKEGLTTAEREELVRLRRQLATASQVRAPSP